MSPPAAPYQNICGESDEIGTAVSDGDGVAGRSTADEVGAPTDGAGAAAVDGRWVQAPSIVQTMTTVAQTEIAGSP